MKGRTANIDVGNPIINLPFGNGSSTGDFGVVYFWVYFTVANSQMLPRSWPSLKTVETFIPYLAGSAAVLKLGVAEAQGPKAPQSQYGHIMA